MNYVVPWLFVFLYLVDGCNGNGIALHSEDTQVRVPTRVCAANTEFSYLRKNIVVVPSTQNASFKSLPVHHPLSSLSGYSTHCISSTWASFVQWPKHERLVFVWFGVFRTFCFALPVLQGAEESGEPQYYENCLCVLCYPFVLSTYLASHILYTYKCEVVRLHAIKEYRGSRDTAPLGLNLGARWGEWSPSHSGRLPPRKNPGTHWVGDWMVLRPALDVLERRKLL